MPFFRLGERTRRFFIFDRTHSTMALYKLSVALLLAPTAAFNFAARLASTPATSTVTRANVVGRLGFVGGGRAGELGGIEATSYGLDGMYGGGMGGYGGGMYGGGGMMSRYGGMGGYGGGMYGNRGMGGMYGGMGGGYGGMGGYGGGYGMMNRGMGGMYGGGMMGGMGGGMYDNQFERQMYGGNGGRSYMSHNQPGGGMGMYNNVNGMR